MIYGKNILLRDFIETDIDKRIYWETVETEWQQWDAPWEYEGMTDNDKKADLERYIQNMNIWVEKYKNISPEQKRYGFQIVINNKNQDYIGWCNSYSIDEDCNYSEDSGHCTIGIDIPELSARGKGFASEALCLFITYLLQHGEQEIYTQTWSGNIRMIHLAKKLGFEEYRRKKNLRLVKEVYYDGLTFRLNIDKFNE